jgi:hypothetical protein
LIGITSNCGDFLLQTEVDDAMKRIQGGDIEVHPKDVVAGGPSSEAVKELKDKGVTDGAKDGEALEVRGYELRFCKCFEHWFCS